jgi:hypothetical protein
MIIVLLLATGSSVTAFGQDTRSNKVVIDQAVVDCSQDKLEEAQRVFRDVLNKDSREIRLTRILEQCSEAPWHQQVSDYLFSVREDRANQLFQIA